MTLAICTTLFLFSCNDDEPPQENKANSPSTETKSEPAPKMDEAAMAKAMQDFSTPGEKHKWLASFNGTWDAEVIAFMNPQKPDTSKAVQTYSMILNGLFQEAKIKGTMMGGPFEGHSISGYDNAKKKYVSTWVDNISSGTTYLTGDYDSTTKTLNLKGTQTDPGTGKDMGIREVLKVIDANTYKLEMYGDGPDGKELKFMEATFKRKK